ncbi:DUF7541 family protein [Halostagnicola kamekurae]|uniref:Cox cluster protein n=1 Tax=Halostagnicola kamekurae TaxID=619731 RepID=A0A1I6TGT7_9EURY|nr:cox cluster protein [Halostagnicola kamekurae]SFS88376.1 hypothetical protein SAMN04488556_3105 [Halostagnicola kamekurae]
MDQPTDQRRSSPWPIVAAFGIVATEAGVLFGLVAIAIAGVLAVGASGAGMVYEAGYTTDRWRPLRIIGAVIAGLAAAVWIAVAGTISPATMVDATATDGIAVRAAIVLAGAVVLVLAGSVGPIVMRERVSDGSDIEF